MELNVDMRSGISKNIGVLETSNTGEKSVKCRKDVPDPFLEVCLSIR